MECRDKCRCDRRPRALVAILVSLMSSALMGGCGPSGPDRVQVVGEVTFDAAPPPAAGTVYFAPIEPAEGLPRRGGYGVFGKGDGTFVVGSVKPDDGLVPGKYRVTIECWEQSPGDDGTPGKSLIPDGYTPPELEIEVGAGGQVRADYDIPSRPSTTSGSSQTRRPMVAPRHDGPIPPPAGTRIPGVLGHIF